MIIRLQHQFSCNVNEAAWGLHVCTYVAELEPVSWPLFAILKGQQVKLLLSIVCPQEASPPSPLCSRSPRRQSCGRPCWRRPPGIRRRRTRCKLKDGETGSEYRGEWWCDTEMWTRTLTSRLTVFVVASEEISSSQTTADVKQEETHLPTIWCHFLRRTNRQSIQMFDLQKTNTEERNIDVQKLMISFLLDVCFQ